MLIWWMLGSLLVAALLFGAGYVSAIAFNASKLLVAEENTRVFGGAPDDTVTLRDRLLLVASCRDLAAFRLPETMP